MKTNLFKRMSVLRVLNFVVGSLISGCILFMYGYYMIDAVYYTKGQIVLCVLAAILLASIPMICALFIDEVLRDFEL